MTEQDLSLKYGQSLEQNIAEQKGQNLSIEVLWVSLGQRAVKLQGVKVVDLKKFSFPAGFEPQAFGLV